jgi:hypothetical protein
MSNKLTIKEEMRSIDVKDRTWYNSLTDEEKKKVGIWVLMRYASSVKHGIKDFEEHYLEWTNELVNVHFNTLRHHPELQYQLLQAVGLGKIQYHPWIAPGKKGTDKPLFKFFKEKHPEYNDDELAIFLLQYDKAEITDILEQYGLEKKDIKKLLK